MYFHWLNACCICHVFDIFRSCRAMMYCRVMFSKIICVVWFALFPKEVKLFLGFTISQPIVSHIPRFWSFWCILSYKTPVAVELSIFIGVDGWGWFNFSNIRRIGIDICVLWNTSATSTSTADVTTSRRVLHSTWTAPFSFAHVEGSAIFMR